MARKYKQEQYSQDMKVIRYIERNGLNLQDISKDIEGKIYVLENICSYHGLRVGSNGNSPFAPIRQCSEGKISSTVIDRYNRAKKRVSECNQGKRKITEVKPTNLEATVKQLSFDF
jgi:hypothetical protein